MNKFKFPMKATSKVAKSIVLKNAMSEVVKRKSGLLTVGNIVFAGFAIGAMYKASGTVNDLLEKFKEGKKVAGDDADAKKTLYAFYAKELAKAIWPVAAFYAGSIICSIAEYKDNKDKAKTIAALTAAAGVAETTISAYHDFKEEAVKELGKEKVEEIENRAIVEKAKNSEVRNPVTIQEGQTLFIDPFTFREFSCNKTRIEDISESFRTTLNYEEEVPLPKWYEKIGLTSPDWAEYAVIANPEHTWFNISVGLFDDGEHSVYIPKFEIYTHDRNGALVLIG